MNNKKKKNIVTIGGGSGQYVLLSSLRDIPDINITAIVSMVDSGGSTGRLRDELGILPPGDIFKCILALSPDREYARKILQKRFSSNNRLNGHNAGNMLLTILSQYAGNFPAGVEALAEVLDIKGKILPVTIDRATLVAELTDGSHLYGESAIDIPRGDQREKIKNAFLVPHHSDSIKVYEPALEAILNADYIIIGPGDLYTSIIPNFIVPGVVGALKEAKAKFIYIINVMTKFGETDNFKIKDFMDAIENFTKQKMDIVIVNSKKPSFNILNQYKKQKAYFINPEIDLKDRKIIKKDLLDVSGDVIRHHIAKLAKTIKEEVK